MKKLSSDELQNLTESKALKITKSFGKHIEHNSDQLLAFEDVLEYDRESILIALLFLLKKVKNDPKQVETLTFAITCLFTSFIPSPEMYKRKLEEKDRFEKLTEQVK